jgi:PAS domain S-box-containing protein
LSDQQFERLSRRLDDLYQVIREHQQGPLPQETCKQFESLQMDLRLWFDAQTSENSAEGVDEGEIRRHAEQMEYHAHLLEFVHDAIIATDPDFIITFWNQAAEELYGWSASEVIGKKLSDVIHSDLLHSDLDSTLQALMMQGRYRYDVGQTTRSGQRIFVDATGIILSDEHGTVTGYLSATRDITARKQAEAQAARERNRAERLAEEARQRAVELDAIFKSLAEAVIVYDPEGIVVRANPAAVNILGVDPVGMDRRDVVSQLNIKDEEDRKLSAEDMPASLALRGQQVVNRLVRIIQAHGEQIHVSISASPLPVIDNEPTGVVSIWHNITEQVNVRQLVEEERARLKAVFEYAPSGVVVTDHEARVMLSNPEAERIFGRPIPFDQPYETHEQMQICYPDGSPVDPRSLPLTRATLDGEVNINLELAIRQPDGHLRPILINSAPIRSRRGRVMGAVAVFQDISDRKRHEQQLRESEERFVVALRNSPISVYTTDNELRYTWVHNPPLGLAPENMLARRDDEIFSPSQAEMMMAFKRRVLESGSSARQEIILQHNGQSYIFDVTAEPLYDSSSHIEGLTVAAVDVTEQRQMEAEMQRSAMRIQMQHYLTNQRELERMQIARDLHDGPLQDLIAVTFGIQAVLDETQGTPHAHLLQELQNELQRQVANLRSFSYELRPPMLNNFSLERTIRSHAEGFAEKNPNLNVHLDLQPDDNRLPDAVRTALFRIYQEALNNVLRHANTGEVYVRLEINEHSAQLEVLDKGAGFKVPSDWLSFARKGHLGLVGIQERVDAVGGKMKLASQPGHGTQLLVTIPIGVEESQ